MKVGLDIGYSAVKLCYGSGKHPAQLTLPVGTALLSNMATGLTGKAVSSGYEVMLQDERWVAGVRLDEIPDYERIMDSTYPRTPEYLALARAAFSAVGCTTIDSLVVA